jgi:hypothetical protein
VGLSGGRWVIIQLPTRPKADFDTELSADRGKMPPKAKKKKVAKKVKDRKRKRREKTGANWKRQRS